MEAGEGEEEQETQQRRRRRKRRRLQILLLMTHWRDSTETNGTERTEATEWVQIRVQWQQGGRS